MINDQLSGTMYVTFTDGTWSSGGGGPYYCD